MVFPVLFAAGMALIDTNDGVLMLGAYNWAFVKPARNLHSRTVRTVRPSLRLGRRRLEDPRALTDPHRHRNGSGGRRRPYRLGRVSGASHRRGDPEPCSALAGYCRAEQRGHCGEHPQARG